ncbi:D-alanine--D-alanine ligase [PVC group bacterium]|nr:D-alanine--D-alanine ligase [PVC group bacterium]
MKEYPIIDRTSHKVAVMMGGTSSEKEISINSGTAIAQGLSQLGWKITPMILENDSITQSDLSGIDCVFIALHGGFGENGELQSVLEEWGIPYTGSGPKACQICMNKKTTKDLLIKGNLPTPDFIVAHKHQPLPILDNVLYPVAVKPVAEGSSIGLTCVKKFADLKAALKKAWEFGEEALIETWIEGHEITFGVLGEEALPLIEILPAEEFYNYTAKYDSHLTRYLVPAPLEDQETDMIQKMGLEAFKLLGCYGYARVDMLLTPDMKPYILELNTVPGFTMTSLFPKAARAANLSFGELCERLIIHALERHPKEHADQK